MGAKRPDLFIATSGNDRDAILKVNEIFADGVKAGVADIQLRLEGGVLQVQHVGDRIETVGSVEGPDAKLILDRIKSRAGISQTEFLTPKDGRFDLTFDEAKWGFRRELDVRVSVIPTDAGETMVCRLLAQVDENLSLDRIRMSSPVRNKLEGLLREKSGIFIVCGPVGSGKTTLLFSLLAALKKMGKNIKTIEDPVEIALAGIDQMQVSNKLSFEQGIRAMVRQRVHVGLVGEVRDEETALTAFRVGNTGTLILFTIHADDAASVITRCEDLGIDRQTFAQAVRLIVFTRLIDGLPKDGDYPRVEPSEASRNWLESAELFDGQDRFIEVPDSDYKGKIPLFEMIEVTPRMRRAIVNGGTRKEIFEAAAMQPQFETLAECAVRHAREGKTTLSAVQELVGETVQAVHSNRIDKRLYAQKIITASQQFECVERWGELRQAGKVVPLWQVVLDMGFASLEQVMDIVGADESCQDRVAFYVERGLFSREDAQPVIAQWKDDKYAQSLFSLLESHNLASHDQIYVKEVLHFRRGGMLALE